MGIETSPLDVEESTEPPICPCKEDRQQQQSTIAFSDLNADSFTENAETVTAASSFKHLPKDSRKETTDFSNGNSQSQVSGSLSEYAHTLDPDELAFIVQADLQYASTLCMT